MGDARFLVYVESIRLCCLSFHRFCWGLFAGIYDKLGMGGVYAAVSGGAIGEFLATIKIAKL